MLLDERIKLNIETNFPASKSQPMKASKKRDMSHIIHRQEENIYLPKQLIPNLVGSSEVNMTTSNDLIGLNPDLSKYKVRML